MDAASFVKSLANDTAEDQVLAKQTQLVCLVNAMQTHLDDDTFAKITQAATVMNLEQQYLAAKQRFEAQAKAAPPAPPAASKTKGDKRARGPIAKSGRGVFVSHRCTELKAQRAAAKAALPEGETFALPEGEADNVMMQAGKDWTAMGDADKEVWRAKAKAINAAAGVEPAEGAATDGEEEVVEVEEPPAKAARAEPEE